MSIKLSFQELAKIVGAKEPSVKGTFTGIEHDSRNIKGGELFIALKGDKMHGHQFVSEVLARGAAACLVEDANCATEVDSLIVVPDTLAAYWQIASAWRDMCNATVIAITGSVGKTTTKEMLARILLEKGRGIYSQKSYNNHVGVPYTLCQIGREHDWAVIEIGMNHKGEISALTKIAKPDVAVITKIAAAHIENLGSLEAIAKAKLEIREGLRKDGKLILNGDDSLLSGIKGAKYFGTNADFFCSYSEVKSKLLEGISFKLRIEAEEAKINMQVLGTHNATNAAAAASAAKIAFPELTLPQIETALKKFTPPMMRLNYFELANEMHIIDDSYNANPESMKALLELAGEFSATGAKIGLILGDMRELGSFSEKAHREMGQLASAVKPVFLMAVGEQSKFAVQEAGAIAEHCASPEEAAAKALEYDVDIIFIKASRGTALDKAVLYFQKTIGMVSPVAQSRFEE